MKTAAVIAEYNPFHNGHLNQLARCRGLGFSHIAVIMGGNFMQRGEPALAEKHIRARAALAGGADLVLELPLPYACATAERFAFGAAASFAAMGCVDSLCFGSESGDTAALAAAAEALSSERFPELLAGFLAEGVTFAAARQRAAAALIGEEQVGVLSCPNDLLGVEYMRQLKALGSDIRPVALERRGPGHHSGAPEEGELPLASASYIRGLIAGGDWDAAGRYMPGESLELLRAGRREGLMAAPERLEPIMLYRLRSMSAEDMGRLPDISEGLENRLFAAARQGRSCGEITDLAKTKRYTRARLRRIMLSAVLGIPADAAGEPPPYIRILAMNGRGREILAEAGKSCPLPMSASLARLARTSPRAERFAELESGGTDIYRLLTEAPAPCGTDYTAGLVTD